MPLITIRAVEGALTPAQREDLMSRVTDAVIAVQGEGVRRSTWILFDEIRERCIAVGGAFVSGADVRAMMGAHADDALAPASGKS